jgi:NAD(P)-dependent dehydrogenase (short-subunit alcohol dehydrogenase family)
MYPSQKIYCPFLTYQELQAPALSLDCRFRCEEHLYRTELPLHWNNAGSGVWGDVETSRRGGPRTAAFAPAKAAQRMLAESMARSLWPQGIHVALIVVDAVVDLPGTRRNMPDKPDSFFLRPDDMAATAVWLAQQPRSAWTFEAEVRPFSENW